jgi:hypothetical protein
MADYLAHLSGGLTAKRSSCDEFEGRVQAALNHSG